MLDTVISGGQIGADQAGMPSLLNWGVRPSSTLTFQDQADAAPEFSTPLGVDHGDEVSEALDRREHVGARPPALPRRAVTLDLVERRTEPAERRPRDVQPAVDDQAGDLLLTPLAEHAGLLGVNPETLPLDDEPGPPQQAADV